MAKAPAARKATPAARQKAAEQELDTDQREIESVLLADLDFDPDNPRFGMKAGERQSQSDILDFIVKTFGVDDVLSSIAVNGYFLAEPLICREQADGRLTVMEGNRRLAACLILADDDRAANQQKKRAAFVELQEEAGRKPFYEVPVIRFGAHEKERELLSYLGVRHIAASQGWDSFAKAGWISRAVQDHGITLREISTMTGDQHKTVQRLLEGYYFINQLIDSKEFIPEASARKGRGSNPEFPFSWIYTLFFYPKARDFVGLPQEPGPNPIPKKRVKDAAMLVDRMFGNTKTGVPAAIQDSREIGGLASSLDSPEKVELLKRGRSVDEIEFLTKPVEERLREGLADCKEILGNLVGALDATPPTQSTAEAMMPLAKQTHNLAQSLLRKLNEIQLGTTLD